MAPWSWLAGLALAGSPVAVESGHLVGLGERIGGARVVEVEKHAEFERMHLKLPDGRPLVVELTLGGGSPACAAHGLHLQPRWELLGESHEKEAQPSPIPELCQRLSDRGPLRVEATPGEVESAPVLEAAPNMRREPGGGTSWVRRLLSAAWVLFGVLAAGTLVHGLRQVSGRKEWGELGFVTGLSALCMLLVSPRGPLIGPDGAWISLDLLLSHNAHSGLYGAGFGSLLGPLTGGSPEVLFFYNQTLALLFAPLMWAVGRLWGGNRAVFLGLSGAVLPVLVRLAGSEVAHVLVLLVETVSVLACLAAVRLGTSRWSLPYWALGGLCVGLVGHIRPEAMAFPLVLGFIYLGTVGMRLPAWTTLAAVPFLGLSLARLSELGDGPRSGAAVPSFLGDVGRLFHTFRPHLPWETERFGGLLAQNMAWSPIPTVILLHLGLWRGGAAGRWLGLAWIAACLPVIAKDWPLTDLWRLQLPATLPALLLAAIGWDKLGGDKVPARRQHIGLLVCLVGSLLPLGNLLGGAEWAPRAEWAQIRQIATLPAGATVLWPDDLPNAAAALRVLSAQHPDKKIRGMGEFLAEDQPVSDLFVFVGTSCVVGYPQTPEKPIEAPICEGLKDRCRLSPFSVRTVQLRGDLDMEWPESASTLGIYRVDHCGQTP
jgi:hypothetical protein